MEEKTFPHGFHDMAGFGLIDALLGRRSRRFFLVPVLFGSYRHGFNAIDCPIQAKS